MKTLRLLGSLWRGVVKAVFIGFGLVWMIFWAWIGVRLVLAGWHRAHIPRATEFDQLAGYVGLGIGAVILLLLAIQLLNLLPTSQGNLHGSSRLASWRSVRRRGIGKGW